MEHLHSTPAVEVVSDDCRHAEGPALSAEQPGTFAVLFALPHFHYSIPWPHLWQYEGVVSLGGTVSGVIPATFPDIVCLCH